MTSIEPIFAGKYFDFYGFTQDFETELRTIVKAYGASKCKDDPSYAFVNIENYNSAPTQMKMYDATFILRSIQANKCLDIEDYRFDKADKNSDCYAAKYILRTEDCARFYFDNICQKCNKQSKDSIDLRSDENEVSGTSMADDTADINRSQNVSINLLKNPFYAKPQQLIIDSQNTLNGVHNVSSQRTVISDDEEEDTQTPEPNLNPVSNTDPPQTSAGAQNEVITPSTNSSKQTQNHSPPAENRISPQSKSLSCQRHNCVVSSKTHNIHDIPKRNFAFWEDKWILRYLISNHCISRSKGIDVYNVMHNEGYMLHRSAQSMNNRMRKHILPNIKLFKLKLHEEIQFQKLKEN